MKIFVHSRNGAPKGGLLIIIFTFLVLSTGLSQTPTPQPCVYAVTGTMAINSAGHDYVVGDRLRAVGGTACVEAFPLSLRVDSIDGNGGVTAATIIDEDSNGYRTAPPTPISFGGSATGANFKATFTFATR